jgi:drug/metabolite transporter (DMT)-like permease
MAQALQDTNEGTRAGTGALAGIVFALVASFFFVGQDAGVKWLSAEAAVMQILFLRSAFGVAYCLVHFGWRGTFGELWVAQPWLMMIRCVVNFAAWCMFFTALVHIPIANALALFFLFPLLITAMSAPLLGEAVGVRRWIAVIVGFSGVVVMLNPTAGVEWPSLLVLGAAVAWSLTAIMTRRLARTETPMATLFYTLATFVALASAPQVLVWEPLPLATWGLLAAVSALGVLAQFLIITAYSRASPSVVAPFEYSALLWAAAVGYVLWGDVPGLQALIGAAIIVGSGIYIIHREARRTPA